MGISKTQAFGISFVLSLFVAFLMPLNGFANESFIKATSPNFNVTSTLSEKDTLIYVRNLERFRYIMRLLNKDTDDLETAPLNLMVLNQRKDYYIATQKVDENSSGILRASSYGAYGIASVFSNETLSEKSDITDSDNFSQYVLFKSYAHVYLATLSEKNYPNWFINGLSEYFGTATFKDDKVLIGKHSYAVDLRALMFVDDEGKHVYSQIINQTVKKKDSLYYSQEWLLTHWLLAKPERLSVVSEYFAVVHEGKDPHIAFEEYFKVPVKDLHRVLDKYLKSFQAEIYSFTGMVEPEISVTRLSINSKPLTILETSILSLQFSQEKNNQILKAVYDEVAKVPSDQAALRSAAIAEIIIGDHLKGRQFFLEEVKSPQAKASDFYFLGLSYFDPCAREERKTLEEKRPLEVRNADRKTARKYFAKAYSLDSKMAENLYSLSRTDPIDAPISTTSLNSAIQAYNLTPVNIEYAYNAADSLLVSDRRDEALDIFQYLSTRQSGHMAEKYKRAIAAIDAGSSYADVKKILFEK